MYALALSLGKDMVVSPADEAKARAEIAAIEKANEVAKKKYAQALASYEKKLAERRQIIAKNEADAAAYSEALRRYNATAQNLRTQNAALTADYELRKALWSQAYARYQASVQSYQGAMAARGAATSSVLRRHGVSAPPNYPGCLTAAERAQYQELCRQQQSANVTVRGLGNITVTPGAPVCAWAELPLCTNIPAPLPNPGSEPTRPTLTNIPQAPGRMQELAVPAEPKPPVPPKLRPVPNLVVAPPDLPVPPMSIEPKSYAVAGLLALAVVGGGAAYWYVKRKKVKAA